MPKSYTAKTLATELAKRTRFLKDEIVTEELKTGTESIHGFYEAFKEFLIAGITEEEFADLYSQTLTYGLFAARLRAGEEFKRKTAFDFIPKTIGILRDIFRFISIEDPPEQMQIIIDDIAEVLAVADGKKILNQYFREGKGGDPVLHFYETFLEVYDPDTREKRGVYYTPEPVVSFIVRSLHQILKDKFDLADGLASKNVTLLDPAGGTLSFPAKAIQVAVEEFKNKYGEGAVESFLKDQVLENFYAFELMMAPYAIGHMKMSFLLEELGYRLDDKDRVRYYLTNALEMKELEEAKFPGMSSLSHESHEAGKVKKKVPILVILGNPPYSYDSPNKGEWISNEIKEYYKVDGKQLGEKNPKGLQDDYVKFIRFAQWKIDQAGEGILGFITNHSYLDNPTFRGMRQSLMNSFDEIYILDLHGNSIKKEKAPDGGKDENVFDITVGTSIAFFIRNKRAKENKKNKLLYSEIFGLREKKYKWLLKNNISTIKWKKIIPSPEFYLFLPVHNTLLNQYNKFPKILEIFPINNVGIVTSRDNLVVDFDKKKLERRIGDFCNPKIEDDIIKQTYNLRENDRWKIKEQREKLFKDENWENTITKILYRPFDNRWILFHDEMIERTRRDIMSNLQEENIALCVGRQFSVIGSENYDIVFVTNEITDYNLYRRGGELIFPLYLYTVKKENRKNISAQLMIFEPVTKYAIKQPNISEDIFIKLKKEYHKEPKPEDIFYYTYAVLYGNTYRTKFREFLKIDFPRIPFTRNYKLFTQFSKLGKQLADLHLLKSKELEKPIAKFPVSGENKVEKPTYKNECVYINKKQYFKGVAEEVWKYQIGGYRVSEKWLKDRKNRTISLDEITTYCKIVTALSKTIDIQKEIDELYEGVEK